MRDFDDRQFGPLAKVKHRFSKFAGPPKIVAVLAYDLLVRGALGLDQLELMAHDIAGIVQVDRGSG